MTEKELKKKIEEILLFKLGMYWGHKELVKDLLSLYEKEKKEFALSCLPKERKLKDYQWDRDTPVLKRKYPYEATIFNQAIKQAREKIDD